MLLASLPNTPIKRLVINDVGALIPKAAIERIGQYVGADPHFAALEDVEKFIRTVSAPFGPLTDAQWAMNVNTLIELGVPHISAYALTVEPKTPLEKQIRLKQKPEVDTDQQARQYLWLMERLKSAGFEHYEISNFAKPGYRSRHNSSYWQGIAYLGIGPSAHSYQPPRRSWQIANNTQYIDRIQQNDWIHEFEILTPAQQLNERVMIALRTNEGLNLHPIPLGIQQTWKPLLDAYEKNGLMIRIGDQIMLTPNGRLQADGIAASLFVEETDQIS